MDNVQLIGKMDGRFKECSHVLMHRTQLGGISRTLSEINSHLRRGEWISAFETVNRLAENIANLERTQARVVAAPYAHTDGEVVSDE